jgi:hypothetical protein
MVKKGSAAVTRPPALAKDLQGGEVSLLLKDVAYDFPEALNNARPADTALSSLGGVIEMLNWFLPGNARRS